VRIRVKREHIDNGEPGNEFACPIALAGRERFPEASEVEVTDTRVVVTLPGRQLTYWHDAHDFVEEFDDGYGVKPRFVRLTDGYEEEAW